MNGDGMRRLAFLSFLGSFLGITSCGGDLVLPNEGQPAALTAVRGDRQNGTVGQALPDSLVVRVTDPFGEPVPGAEVVWVAEDGGSVDPATAKTDAAGQAATMRTLGAQPGTYTTRASVTGLTAAPVLFLTTGLTATLSAATSTVAASPATIVANSGGTVSTITVTARDGLGNPLSNVTVVIDATGSGNSIVQPAGATNAEGVATGTFSSTSPGDHVVTATLDGTTADQTATVTVTAGPPVASASSAQVGAGTAGVTTDVTITLGDASGNPVTGAAGKIQVNVTGANTAGGSVSESGGGAYLFRYTPIKTGTDKVRVRVDGIDVPGSPFSSAVSPGPADAAHTTAVVPPQASIFGPPVSIVVTVRDAKENLVGHGGDNVAISVDRGHGGLQVTDAGNGTYTATFRPGALGMFTVTITLSGAQISGSPYSTNVTF
jgi:Invasin, domain 3/Filamin/ABP280 repeat/Bacterial Ig-like domain (group 1)